MNKKVYKALSHIERMNNANYCGKVDQIKPKKYTVDVLESYIDDETGRVAQKYVKKVIDKKVELSKFKVSDFCIENLQAAGVDLKPCTLSGNVIGNIDNIVTTLDSLDIEVES